MSAPISNKEEEEPPTKRAKMEATVDNPRILNNPDVWVNNILPFVGPGNFIFVAGVNKRMKELYKEYFDAIKKEELPNVATYKLAYYAASKKTFPTAIVSNTFYSAAFASVTCAMLWENTNTHKKIAKTKRYSHCFKLLAKAGNFNVVVWAHKNGYSWDKNTCYAATENGHLEVLQYLHQNDCEWDKWACSRAAAGGHLEVLKYLHKNGCLWNWKTCYMAAQNGHLEVLKYAHENECAWNTKDACRRAMLDGQVGVLAYAH